MYVDLSYQGRLAAKRGQLDNGQMPHGGYKGSRRHPPCLLSFTRGEDFQQNLDQEIQRLLWETENLPNGSSPAWSILIHKEPSYTDESPLMTKNLLAASKSEQAGPSSNRSSQASNKSRKPVTRGGKMYYRPNSTHQFLSATDLKQCSQVECSTCRPTRTTLLRALHRRHSASANVYQTQRDFLHRLSDIRNSSQVSLTSDSFRFETAREGESLHSFLTGTRYNRYNPELGCFFTLPREQIIRQKYEAYASPPPTPESAELRPYLDPTHRFRSATVPAKRPSKSARYPELVRSSQHTQDSPLKLRVIGSNIAASHLNKRLTNSGADNLLRQYKFSAEDALRQYDYSPASSSSKPTQDVQSVHESFLNELVNSNSEPQVESSKGSAKLRAKMTNLKNDAINKKTENRKMQNVAVQVFSLSAKRMSVPSIVSTPVCVPSLNQDQLIQNSVHAMRTDKGEAKEEVTMGATHDKNFEKVVYGDNENDANVNEDLLESFKKAKRLEIETIDDMVNKERANADLTNKEDVDEDEVEAITDNLPHNDNTHDSNKSTHSDEKYDLFEENGDRVINIKELSEVEEKRIANISEKEEDSNVNITNFSETEEEEDAHSIHLLEMDENEDHNVTDLSQTEEDPNGLIINLSETEEETDEHNIHLSETEKVADGQVTNLSEKEEYPDEHVPNLSETEEDPNGQVSNLSETEIYPNGQVPNLSETEEYPDEQVQNLSETEKDPDGQVPNLSETEGGHNEDETEIGKQQKHHSVRFFITEEKAGSESVAGGSSHMVTGNENQSHNESGT